MKAPGLITLAKLRKLTNMEVPPQGSERELSPGMSEGIEDDSLDPVDENNVFVLSFHPKAWRGIWGNPVVVGGKTHLKYYNLERQEMEDSEESESYDQSDAGFMGAKLNTCFHPGSKKAHAYYTMNILDFHSEWLVRKSDPSAYPEMETMTEQQPFRDEDIISSYDKLGEMSNKGHNGPTAFGWISDSEFKSRFPGCGDVNP